MSDPFAEVHVIVWSGGSDEATIDYATDRVRAKQIFDSHVTSALNTGEPYEYVQWVQFTDTGDRMRVDSWHP